MFRLVSWGTWERRERQMAFEGPQLAYARKEDEPALVRALQLARELEGLLEQASSATANREVSRGAHSTRIVRAMAAGIVDELEVLVRGEKRSSIA